MGPGEWDDQNTRCIGMLMDGRAQETGIKRRGADATMLIVFNGWQDLVGFILPEPPDGGALDAAAGYQPAGPQRRTVIPAG